MVKFCVFIVNAPFPSPAAATPTFMATSSLIPAAALQSSERGALRGT